MTFWEEKRGHKVYRYQYKEQFHYHYTTSVKNSKRILRIFDVKNVLFLHQMALNINIGTKIKSMNDLKREVYTQY